MLLEELYLSKLDVITKLKEAILDGNKELCEEIIDEALLSGIEPMAILNTCIEGINIVGEKFGKGEIFLTELMLSADAMKAAVEKLKPKFTAEELIKTRLGKVVIGTVKGDIHDIGKNIVITMLTAAGFEVFDIGIDVPPVTFIEKAKEVNADIIGASALLTSTKPYMEDIALLLKDMDLRSKFKYIVGGAPVTQDYAEKIGADGYAKDAQEAVRVVKELIKK
jgi:corrinoid protein of di/trimethylamine methyltransferase